MKKLMLAGLLVLGASVAISADDVESRATIIVAVDADNTVVVKVDNNTPTENSAEAVLTASAEESNDEAAA